MLLQTRIGARIRRLREEKKLTQETLAGLAHSDAATLSRIESGKRNVTAETLGLIMSALGVTPREFFDTEEFEEPITADPDDPESINSERFSVDKVGDSVRVNFQSGAHDASADFKGLDRARVTEAILTMRRGLRQAEITAQVGEQTSDQKESGPVQTAIMSGAIAESFLSLVRGNPLVNPSDVWRYIISPAFREPQNHPASSSRKNLEQSFKRTSGWAFERVLAAHYNPFLKEHGVILSKADAQNLLSRMGLADQVHPDKIDLFIVDTEHAAAPLGVIHLKSSLAERRTDDVPASRLVIDKGYVSLFVTLDGKDTPGPHPVNKGEYGRALAHDPETGVWQGSDKRKDIELNGLFSAVFSYNSRTIESPATTRSGCRIMRANFANPDDRFSRFILDTKARRFTRPRRRRT